MKWIREVDELHDAAATRYVRLDVLPMPSDATTVAGLVTMDDPDAEHQIGSHHSALPMAIEIAHCLALKIARERGAEIIWINDPKGLYPRNKRATGQMRTFPVLVMPGGRLTSDLRIDAVSPEVAALVACGAPLIERGSRGNLACEVFDRGKRITFYRPPDAVIMK
jgi:hypothetical protein